jgi:class 3 adenylate cyclase
LVPEVEISLPTGIVTFLFTDVVGSSSLWDRATNAMAMAIRRHDALLDAAVTQLWPMARRFDGVLSIGNW